MNAGSLSRLHAPLYGIATILEGGALTPSMVVHPELGDLFPVFTAEEGVIEWAKTMPVSNLASVLYKRLSEARDKVSDAAIRGLKYVVVDHLPPKSHGTILTVNEFLTAAADSKR